MDGQILNYNFHGEKQVSRWRNQPEMLTPISATSPHPRRHRVPYPQYMEQKPLISSRCWKTTTFPDSLSPDAQNDPVK